MKYNDINSKRSLELASVILWCIESLKAYNGDLRIPNKLRSNLIKYFTRFDKDQLANKLLNKIPELYTDKSYTVPEIFPNLLYKYEVTESMDGVGYWIDDSVTLLCEVAKSLNVSSIIHFLGKVNKG